jgi:hypothetical protein
MNIYNRYSPVKEYRTIEPEVRITYPGALPSTDTYLENLDSTMEASGASMLYSGGGDLFSLIFANQATTRAANSRQLATLILEREKLARKHMRDVDWRMGEVQARRPELLHQGARPGDLFKIDQQMSELDKQKRDIELGLWQDILELRRDLHEERREYRATRQRMAHISGGSYETS